MPSEAAIKAKHFGAAANTQRQVAMEAETYKTVNNVTNEKTKKTSSTKRTRRTRKTRTSSRKLWTTLV